MEHSKETVAIRSTKEIKARLLRDAWMTGAAADIISRIQDHHRRVETMPEGHKEALWFIVPNQDPALMRVNLRNYLEGHGRFSAAGDTQAPKLSTETMQPTRYEAHDIYDQIMDEQKKNAEAPDFMLQHGALMLAEDIADAAATGRPYYADDVSMTKFTIRNSGELNLEGQGAVHEAYADSAYQALQNKENLSPVFGEAASRVREETYYADDAYLAAHPAAASAEDLDTAPHANLAAPYQDDAFTAKSDGLDVEEYLRDIFGGEAAGPSETTMLATQLCHEKLPAAQSPYVDAFFNAGRWAENAIEAERAKQLQDMDTLATAKPHFILQ